MDNPRPEPLVYRVPDVCTMLGISRAHGYRLIKSGTIPTIRYGRSVRVPAWWVDEQRRRAA